MATGKYDKDGEVGIITLSNPPQNRIDSTLLAALDDGVQSAVNDGVRALVFRGDGDHFSLGADITEWRTLPSRGLQNLAFDFNHILERIEELPLPTIAAVHGGCMGGGFELALHCDIIVAAEDAEFRFPEATLAIPPLAGGIQRLAERVGRAAATRIIFLTDPVSATEAQQLGFVARISESAARADTALELARQLTQGPTLAYAATKGVLRAWSQGGLGAADRMLLQLSEAALSSEDFGRAVPNAVHALERNVPRPVLTYNGK